MTYFGTSDLPSMLAGFGVPVVWGSITAKGIVDVVDLQLFSDTNISITGKEKTLTVQTETFAGLKEGDRLTIEGITHRVIQTRQQGDGALMAVLVMPV